MNYSIPLFFTGLARRSVASVSVASAEAPCYAHFFKLSLKITLLSFLTIFAASACKAPVETEDTEKLDSQKRTEIESMLTKKAEKSENPASKLDDNRQSSDSQDSIDAAVGGDSAKFTPKIVQPVQINTAASTAASRIVESLELSQAKLAASSRDKCPKLIVPRVDSHQIVRKDEVMTSDHCDYYLYPVQGETISVSSYPDTTQATLIAPVIYDFENGGYRTNSADKHIIRIAYTGSESRFDPLDYDVVIAVY